MKDLPAELVLQKNVWSDSDPWLLFVELTLLDSSINRYVSNSQDVDFDGFTWSATSLTSTAVDSVQQGALSEITLTLTNVGRGLIDILDDPDDIIGAQFKLIFVHYGNLDVDHSSLEVTYKVKNYKINSLDVDFTLGDETLVIQRHPPRLFTTLQCEWAPHNFKGAECQYVGPESTCNGLLATCRTRSAGSNTAHFGGSFCLHNDGLKVAIVNG